MGPLRLLPVPSDDQPPRIPDLGRCWPSRGDASWLIWTGFISPPYKQHGNEQQHPGYFAYGNSNTWSHNETASPWCRFCGHSATHELATLYARSRSLGGCPSVFAFAWVHTLLQVSTMRGCCAVKSWHSCAYQLSHIKKLLPSQAGVVFVAQPEVK